MSDITPLLTTLDHREISLRHNDRCTADYLDKPEDYPQPIIFIDDGDGFLTWTCGDCGATVFHDSDDALYGGAAEIGPCAGWPFAKWDHGVMRIGGEEIAVTDLKIVVVGGLSPLTHWIDPESYGGREVSGTIICHFDDQRLYDAAVRAEQEHVLRTAKLFEALQFEKPMVLRDEPDYAAALDRLERPRNRAERRRGYRPERKKPWRNTGARDAL